MSADAFLSLYYTDCRPGQGLRGGAGFQFQSVSAGVGHDAMTLVQRSALYEAPVSWMREHRPVTSYPPSLTHVFDGVYVTARGIYLGAEVNGVREGNQFTHAVTTGDPEVYGLIRPAQFWGAPWWSEQPAAGTECDPVPAQPEQGPWGIDAIRDWVLGQPQPEDWLTAVSSAFDRAQNPDGRRVVFVGADAESILGWIAAGTLLLPQARALRLGFRVFTTNPQYSQHEVLGLHPDWAGPFANPDRDREFVVFNLDSARHSGVEPTEAAAYWVPRFLRADPFDVVDAVELAHEFARQRLRHADPSAAAADARPSPADRLASAAVVLDEPVSAGQDMTRWLAEQPSLSPEDIVAPLAEAVLAGSVDAMLLGELDDAVRRRGLGDELVGRIRRELLAAEIDEVVSGRTQRPVDTPLPRHSWTQIERKAAAALIEHALSTVPPQRMDLVLRLSKRFTVEPRLANVQDVVHRFITWWVDHPAASLDPTGWPCRAELIGQLRVELCRRPDAAIREGVRRHWWRILLPVTDPSSALDASVAAAALEHGEPAVRRRVKTAVLDFAAHSDRPDAGDLAWDALFRYVPPQSDQLLDLLDRLRPDRASRSVATKTSAELLTLCRQRVTSAELDVLELLAKLGWEAADNRLVDLRRQDATLRQWLAALPAPDAHRAGQDASALSSVTGTVLRARRSEVLAAILDLVPPAHALDVVDGAGDHLKPFLVQELPEWWYEESDGGRRGDIAVAVAYISTGSVSIPDELVAQFETKFKKWVRAAQPGRVSRVERLLRAVDDPELVESWREVVKAALPRLRKNSAARKSPSTGKDLISEKATTKQPKRTGWWLGRRRGGQ